MSQKMLITAAHLLPGPMYAQCYKVIRQKMNILPLIVEAGIFLFQNPSIFRLLPRVFSSVFHLFVFKKTHPNNSNIILFNAKTLICWPPLKFHHIIFPDSCPRHTAHTYRFFKETEYNQMEFAGSLNRWAWYHIIPQLAVYTTYRRKFK